MSEGGRFPWKLQKIFSVPVGRYERLRESLPKPPDGMAWYQNKETREWKLVPEEELARLELSKGSQEDVQQQQEEEEEEEEVTVDFAANSNNNHNEKRKSPFENPFQIGKQEQEQEEVHEQDTDKEHELKVDLQASETTQTTQAASNVHAEGEEVTGTTTRSESPDFSYNNTNTSTPKAKNTSTKATNTTPTPTTHFENLPTDFVVEQDDESKHQPQSNEDDWEFLSESGRNSQRTLNSSTIGDGMAFVTRSGSIKSCSNNSCYSLSYNNNNNNSKLQRSPSSSTIDSHDFHLGPAGKGILGVDYVEHVILPDDTLQGICLAYKISTSRLKRANHFSGESLQLAPKRLIIPISQKAIAQGYLRVQDTDSKEYKLHAFQAEFPNLGLSEARAYLELSDWNLPEACQSAREDNDWEHDQQQQQQRNGQNKSRTLRAGEIRVMMNVTPHPDGPYIDFAAQGAGYRKAMPKAAANQPVSQRVAQAKAVQMEDVHAVSPQHNSFGLELQSFSSSRTTTTPRT